MGQRAVRLSKRKGKLNNHFDSPPQGLVDAISRNRCVLFAGPGLSRGAGMLDCAGFARLSAQDSARPQHDTSNQDSIESVNSAFLHDGVVEHQPVAEGLPRCVGRSLFLAKLGKFFDSDANTPTAMHDALSNIPFRAVVTTNYDDCLGHSFAATRSGRFPATFTANDAADISDSILEGRFFILKALGDVHKPSTLTIADEDVQNLWDRSLGYKTALATIFATQSVFFIGTSFSQLEFRLFLGFLHKFSFRNEGTHYALLPRGRQAGATARRWRAELGARCIHYEPNAEDANVLGFLTSLPHRIQPGQPSCVPLPYPRGGSPDRHVVAR